MDDPNMLFARKDAAEFAGCPMPEPKVGEERVRLVVTVVDSKRLDGREFQAKAD